MPENQMEIRITNSTRSVIRISVGTMFFMTGLCFASWASRIASIQQKLSLSDAQFGIILFALPVGLILSLPLSGWAVIKIGSRRLLATALIAYSLMLISLGLATNIYQFVICLILFGIASNATNISINTQAAVTEILYAKPIMASFHGIWSLAGFIGAGVGTVMMGKNILPAHHFFIIAFITILSVILCWRSLNNDHIPNNSVANFQMPDKSLIWLGLIALCSMICEGAMFDWSVIYFKKIILAEKVWMGAGYTAFMCTMAIGRFVADKFAGRFGLRLTLQVSGSLTAIGLFLTVIFPTLLMAIIGLMLVGVGTSAVVPMVYSAAGKSKTMLTGAAITAISTISFIGFLIGPPIIGLLAGLFSLQVSFSFLAILGLFVVILSTRMKI